MPHPNIHLYCVQDALRSVQASGSDCYFILSHIPEVSSIHRTKRSKFWEFIDLGNLQNLFASRGWILWWDTTELCKNPDTCHYRLHGSDMALLQKSHPKAHFMDLLRGHLIRQAETFDALHHSDCFLTMISTSSKDSFKQFLFKSVLDQFHSLSYPVRAPIFPDFYVIFYDTDASSTVAAKTLWATIANLLKMNGRLDPVFILASSAPNSQSYKNGWFVCWYCGEERKLNPFDCTNHNTCPATLIKTYRWAINNGHRVQWLVSHLSG